ncbi:HAMP domain-containing sensor histidine kinase [Lentisphaera marina]|uniref:HAMP domain-containing sensor histidine kinase n=1 Tax=Lentisphaera marina TaxID=1111041 RepID=UPI00236648FF|nr:HAMP domain-containing sensor histidine kinase [Lentisphaera marina]MDD7985656.1 HAMP domain-containing sensor histidine kinase [Lentisphaera marina]
MSFKLLKNFVLIVYLALGSLFLYMQYSELEVLKSGVADNGGLKEYHDLKNFEKRWAEEGSFEGVPSSIKGDIQEYEFLVLTLKEQQAFDDASEEFFLIQKSVSEKKNSISDIVHNKMLSYVESHVEQEGQKIESLLLAGEKRFLGFLTFFLGFGALLIFLIRSVRKPLDEMAEAMREVRKENFTYSLPIDEERSDELTQLKRDFNIMIRKLEILHRRTEENREQLEHDAKQLKESVVSKTRFIRHLGHELRSPLAAISSFSELMLEGMHGDITVKQEASLQRIMSNAQNLLDLVNDLVDQAKAEAGSLELKLEPKELKPFCEEVLESVKIEAEKGGLKVSTIFDDEVMICEIHEIRFRQVLVNLISNAIKFSKQGGKLELRVLRKGDLAFVEIEDDGVGISLADQRNIFMEFHQGETFQKDRGAGLGLHLSRQIARLHGGDITVISEQGKGSVFRVQLPLSKEKV